jgi:hypothetical protein
MPVAAGAAKNIGDGPKLQEHYRGKGAVAEDNMVFMYVRRYARNDCNGQHHRRPAAAAKPGSIQTRNCS